MRNALLLTLLLGCVAQESSPGSVETECGPPPAQPGVSYTFVTDVNGHEQAVVEAISFRALIQWQSDVNAWGICALGAR